MPVSIEDVRKIADLSKLAYSPEELERFVPHFQEILDYLEQLAAVPTANVEPTYHALEGVQETPARPDQPRASLPRDAAVSNAPLAGDGQFRVPKVIE